MAMVACRCHHRSRNSQTFGEFSPNTLPSGDPMRKTLIALVTAAVAVAPVLTAPLASANPAGVQPVAAGVQGEHVLSVDYQVQQTGYWCGPAATRIALSARGVYRSQSQLAAEL